MARTGRLTRLKLWLLAALVVLAHVLALEWFARQADAISGLTKMVAPMYTRMLTPTVPRPVVASASPPATPPPRARAAVAPRPPASAPEKKPGQRKEQAPPPAPAAAEAA
ncbi:MAG: hypothetical protein JWP41_1972, partial [Ramlibacter sp.]|nr:hypothetical protein [Ramlibacter sp.]